MARRFFYLIFNTADRMREMYRNADTIKVPDSVTDVESAARCYTDFLKQCGGYDGYDYRPSEIDVTVFPWESDGAPSKVAYMDEIDISEPKEFRPVPRTFAFFDIEDMPPIWQTLVWNVDRGKDGRLVHRPRVYQLEATTYKDAVTEHERVARGVATSLPALPWNEATDRHGVLMFNAPNEDSWTGKSTIQLGTMYGWPIGRDPESQLWAMDILIERARESGAYTQTDN